MRTNIDLSDDLIAEAGRHARGKTKKAIVEEALRAFISLKHEQARRRTYEESSRDIERRTASLVLRTSPSALLRADRNRP
jgi:Arc/MetJ family transcription regulator